MSFALILALVAIVFQQAPTTSANRLNHRANERMGCVEPCLIPKDLPPSESSSTKPPDIDDYFESFFYYIQVTYMLISSLGITGNLIVIFVILKFTPDQTVTDILILNLAFADLWFVTGLIMIVIGFHHDVWIFGNPMCKIYLSFTTLNQFASSLLVVGMSFDRYLAVCHPIYSQNLRQPGRVRKVCWCIWLVSFVLQTPVLILARLTIIEDEMVCTVLTPKSDSDYEQAFTWYCFLVGFLFPILLISTFYIQVVRRLRQTSNQPNLRVSARRLRSTNRVARMITVLILTYVICWIPLLLYRLILAIRILPKDVPFLWEFYSIAVLLAHTNSALNPILYAFLSDNFTRRFSQMVVSIRRANLFGRSPQLQTNISSRLAVQTIGQRAQQKLDVELETF